MNRVTVMLRKHDECLKEAHIRSSENAAVQVERYQLPPPPTTQDCPDAHCVNTTTDYVTLNLLGSLQNYWVIAECGLSVSQCRGCQREHKFLRFFAGTPHEQVVDTGRCGGQCSQTGDHVGNG